MKTQPILIDRERVRAADLSKSGAAHKYDHGHALVLSGGAGRTGAARLAARGALRIGAGAVTLGVPPNAQLEVAGAITAIMLTRVADGNELNDRLGDTRLNALCLGPGLGLSEVRSDLVATALTSGRACVLDADALTLIAGSDNLRGHLHAGCVLTPHAGEFARLFPDLAKAQDAGDLSKLEATAQAARQTGSTVLFKGAQTVIASPDGTCALHDGGGAHAAPWLATAGSGDVLAGFITGMLARGFTPQQAAEVATWLHAECARAFGPGLIAEDLPEELPSVLKALGV